MEHHPKPDHISIPLLYLSEKAKGHNSNIKKLEGISGLFSNDKKKCRDKLHKLVRRKKSRDQS